MWSHKQYIFNIENKFHKELYLVYNFNLCMTSFYSTLFSISISIDTYRSSSFIISVEWHYIMLTYMGLCTPHWWAFGLSLDFLYYKQGHSEYLYACPILWMCLSVYFEASNNSLPKVLQVQIYYSPKIVGLFLHFYPNLYLGILD